MGWDAFRMPAEKRRDGQRRAPAQWTYANIALHEKQMAAMGLAIAGRAK